ncbi:amino acid permease [Acidocella sp.]|uniref:amino acid permease n=1 Tax=Acidocella sp. TaxID=50710 RepID=UPI003D0864A3
MASSQLGHAAKTENAGRIPENPETAKARGQPAGMGLVSCTALVIGNMIGSGVFLLPSALAGYGVLAVAGWGLSTAGSLLLAIMFARLAGVLPAAGGPYAYTRVAFGEFAGFLAAWCYWKAAWIGNAAISLSLVGYLSVFFPPLAAPGIDVTAAIIAVWICTFINISGLRLFNAFNVPLTLLKVIPLAAIAILGWRYFNPANLTYPKFGLSIPETNPFAAVATAATLTMWSFIGLESATVPAENVRDARRTIPRATLLGTGFTAVIYVLSVTAVQGMIPAGALAHSAAPFADAAIRMVGAWGGYAIAAGAVVATFGALCGWVLMQGQIPWAAARDGLLPEFLGSLNSRGVPAAGLLISSMLVTLLLLTEGHGALADIFRVIILVGTMTTLVPYALCAAAVLQLLVDRPGLFAAKTAAGMAFIGLAGFIYSVWELYGAGEAAVFWGFLVTIGGVPFYTWRKWRSRVGASKRSAG